MRPYTARTVHAANAIAMSPHSAHPSVRSSAAMSAAPTTSPIAHSPIGYPSHVRVPVSTRRARHDVWR